MDDFCLCDGNCHCFVTRPFQEKFISMMAAEHETDEKGKKIGKLKAGSYIGGITVVSLLAGFGLTLGRVKRKNPTEFGELGANKLALKALGYGTLLSVTGCGLLVLAVKWALGVKNVSCLRNRL